MRFIPVTACDRYDYDVHVHNWVARNRKIKIMLFVGVGLLERQGRIWSAQSPVENQDGACQDNIHTPRWKELSSFCVFGVKAPLSCTAEKTQPKCAQCSWRVCEWASACKDFIWNWFFVYWCDFFCLFVFLSRQWTVAATVSALDVAVPGIGLRIALMPAAHVDAAGVGDEARVLYTNLATPSIG